MMRRRGLALALLLVAACSTKQPPADTTESLTAAAPDTVKPATTPLPAVVDSTKATPSSGAKTASTTAKTKSSSRDTAHLGRDSVIRNDPRDPRFQIPVVPPKKPPQ
jgi:hypothetical protein